MPRMKEVSTYHLEYDSNGKLKIATPVKGSAPGWQTLQTRSMSEKSYYSSPHYAAFVQNLTRTYGGFVLDVRLLDATQSGRNSGLLDATYYWSEQTKKWTPLSQIYGVQTLNGFVQTGSNGVYWKQPSPVGDGSGSQLDVTEMYFDPSTLTTRSVWLGNWFDGPGIVDGDSWVTALPNSMMSHPVLTPEKWTVYTP